MQPAIDTNIDVHLVFERQSTHSAGSCLNAICRVSGVSDSTFTFVTTLEHRKCISINKLNTD